MPSFAGFANMYGLRAAESDYDRAKYNEQQTKNSAMMDVLLHIKITKPPKLC